MSTPAPFSITTVSGGFREVSLRNDVIELSVVPDLGGKVTSLRHLPGEGREWLWEPESFQGYFTSPPGTAFQDGTLVGWDECLPTIAPCAWQGRDLPDHGEVWVSACTLEESVLQEGIIRTSLDLPRSPLRFTRDILLSGNTVHVRYRLENLSAGEERYIWAVHPLLALQPGDELELPPSIRKQLSATPWQSRLQFAEGAATCEKAFADVEGEVAVTIRNAEFGQSLTISWDATELPILGLWLTRGGWHGHHHLALEPTNARDDSLNDAANRGIVGRLPGHGSKEWSLSFTAA